MKQYVKKYNDSLRTALKQLSPLAGDSTLLSNIQDSVVSKQNINLDEIDLGVPMLPKIAGKAEGLNNLDFDSVGNQYGSNINATILKVDDKVNGSFSKYKEALPDRDEMLLIIKERYSGLDRSDRTYNLKQ